MCMTLPHKIVKIDGQTATVEYGNKTHTVDIQLLPDSKVGDWILSENGYAITRVTEEDAQETLKLIKDVSEK